jgi:hypothetical protein
LGWGGENNTDLVHDPTSATTVGATIIITALAARATGREGPVQLCLGFQRPADSLRQHGGAAVGIRVAGVITIFLYKNIKTYLSCPKKGTFRGLPGIALSRGQDIAGHRKKHSFKHSFSPTSQLSSIRVGCLVGCCVGCCVVLMLLLLSSFTLLPCWQHRRHHHRRRAAAADTAATAVGRQGG